MKRTEREEKESIAISKEKVCALPPGLLWSYFRTQEPNSGDTSIVKPQNVWCGASPKIVDDRTEDIARTQPRIDLFIVFYRLGRGNLLFDLLA
jgi:hypothetical protein